MFHILFLAILIITLSFLFLFENFRKVIVFLVIGIIIFCWIPYAINYYSIEKIYEGQNVVEFWTSYLGTIIGGTITLFGVWWQTTRQEKQKEKDEKIGLLKILHHYLKKVLLDKELEKKKYNLLSVLSFTNSSSYIREDIKAIPAFENMSFKENDLKIMRLDYGEELFDINTRTMTFNKEWIFLIKTSKEREKLVEKIKAINNGKIKELMEILDNLSNIIFYYTYFEFTDKNISKINDHKNKLLSKNNFSVLKTDDNKDFMKLFDEKECAFDRQTEKTMRYLSELLVAEVWLLYSSILWEIFITKDEEQILYDYYMSISEIVSIDILELLDTMKKTDDKIVKELEKLKK